MVAQQRVQRVQSSFLHPLLLSSSLRTFASQPLLRNLCCATFAAQPNVRHLIWARHHFSFGPSSNRKRLKKHRFLRTFGTITFCTAARAN
jgi:hypothetical protein